MQNFAFLKKCTDEELSDKLTHALQRADKELEYALAVIQEYKRRHSAKRKSVFG